jgi:hypothetical protein
LSAQILSRALFHQNLSSKFAKRFPNGSLVTMTCSGWINGKCFHDLPKSLLGTPFHYPPAYCQMEIFTRVCKLKNFVNKKYAVKLHVFQVLLRRDFSLWPVPTTNP